MLGVGEVAPADLEQADAVRAAILVALCRGEQAGEQRRAHDFQIFADRIGERPGAPAKRSEEHTSELQSLMRISYAVFCLKKKKRRDVLDLVDRMSMLND